MSYVGYTFLAIAYIPTVLCFCIYARCFKSFDAGFRFIICPMALVISFVPMLNIFALICIGLNANDEVSYE